MNANNRPNPDRPGPGRLDDNGAGMSMIVKTVTRWLK
jgi:hypothetical protein